MRRAASTAQVLFVAAVLAMFCLGLAACALPRITVLGDPLTAEEHLQLGLAYEQDGELDLAEREYEEAAGELPEARYYLGNLAFAREDWDEAERQYEKAVRGLPEDPRPRNNLAWLLYTRGRNLDRAEELARQAVTLATAAERAEYADTLKKIRQARGTGQER